MATEALRSHDRILKKALELFSEKGYDATSVREICEAAGITKPTLYYFYGSKRMHATARQIESPAAGRQAAVCLRHGRHQLPPDTLQG